MRWRNRNHGNTVETIRERMPRQQTAVGWTHDAPAEPFTPNQAHKAMQQHRECPVEDCDRKRTAFQTLIEAGRVKPDSGRIR
ncbi:hypothetical protein IU476_31035 [Nocardia blacklockiae]|nr:hypothetical protein [Nocardia blacklockiae]